MIVVGGLLMLVISFPLFLTKRKCHDWLDWGYPKSDISFDGCSFTSNCRFCVRRLLRDSQSNWFHVEL